MAPNFLSVMWCGEAFPGLGVQGVEDFILVDALFPLAGGRRRKGSSMQLLKRDGIFKILGV
jgi:hypothetical protein